MYCESKTFSNKQVTDSVLRICDSGFFKSSPQLCAFLSFVVTQTLEGHEETIKAYTIATQALGRRDDFDPQSDPIVRVQAGRLRIALERYYTTEGANESLVITLNRGSYVPTFSLREQLPTHPVFSDLVSNTGSENLSLKSDPTFNEYILILDSDADARNLLKGICEKRDFELVETDSVDAFWAAYQTYSPTSIIMDTVEPNTDSAEILRQLARTDSKSRILLTGDVDMSILNATMTYGTNIGLAMVDKIQKPFDFPKLEILLDRSISPTSIGYADIENALNSNEFALQYQPKMSLGGHCGGHICGFEALARWRHPKIGIIDPSVFIPVAIETGQITAITDWVIKSAIDQLQRWCSNGVNVDVSVNLSASDLVDLDLPDQVSALLEDANLPTHKLILEISEATVTPKVTDILTRMRIKGVGLSLDQFGHGYSNLRELYKGPFSEIKIDRSFVSEVEASQAARLIVKAIIELAHSLDLRVCAVGVETAKCLETLRTMNCDSVQGRFVAEPQYLNELNMFFDERFTICTRDHLCRGTCHSHFDFLPTEIAV